MTHPSPVTGNRDNNTPTPADLPAPAPSSVPPGGGAQLPVPADGG